MTLPEVLRPLVAAAPAAAVVCDFDGTLAPIVDDPDRARALPAALAALRGLRDQLALVAVVSGRPAEFLVRQVTVPGVALAGVYGLERVVDGHVVLDPRAGAHADAVAVAADEAARRWPRLRLERKGAAAFALHWRTAPDTAPPADALQRLAAHHGLLVTPGRMAAEVRAPVDMDKGAALRQLLDAHTVDAAAFAGDDQGDLPAFAVLAERSRAGVAGVRVAVASPEAPPALLDGADLVVDGPGGLATVLTDLESALRRRG